MMAIVMPNTLTLFTRSSSIELTVIASNWCCVFFKVNRQFFTLIWVQLKLVRGWPLLHSCNSDLHCTFSSPWDHLSHCCVIHIFPNTRPGSYPRKYGIPSRTRGKSYDYLWKYTCTNLTLFSHSRVYSSLVQPLAFVLLPKSPGFFRKNFPWAFKLSVRNNWVFGPLLSKNSLNSSNQYTKAITLVILSSSLLRTVASLAKWLLEFLGIPRDKGVNSYGKFGLGIPRNS